jgi:hypothetical protein
LLALRDWSRPIDWLQSRRAELPGLIDGWNLAEEYHETHQNRAVVISGSEARISSRGDVVLNRPMPPVAFEAILGTFSSASPQLPEKCTMFAAAPLRTGTGRSSE